MTLDFYYGSANSLAIRRSAFELHGPFVERQRGSDAIFVQHLVAAHPCRAVRYAPDARVRHLEVDSVRDVYRKTFTYGRSLRALRAAVPIRPLGMRERIQVWRAAIRRRDEPLRGRLLLMALLGGGLLCWCAGSVSASIPGLRGES